MATDDNNRHLRYILLLGEGGLLVLRTILERETNKTGYSLDVLLQQYKQNLTRKTNKEQYQKLYPRTGNVDKTAWDISLLGTVILCLFRNTSLSRDESLAIKDLKDLRNELTHCGSVSMEVDTFEDAWKELAALLFKLSLGLDRDVNDKCQNFVKQFHTDPIDVSSATETLKEISNFDKIIAEQLWSITGKVEDVSVKVDRNYDAIQGQQQTAIEPSQRRPEVLGAEKNTESNVSAVESKNILNEEPETETIDSKLAQENDALLDEIIEGCKFSECEDTNHVILLIGTVGAGKSSLINTLHKILTGRYFIIAREGRGISQSVTGELIRYDNCGISLPSISDVPKLQKIKKIYEKLPQIVDFAGLGNVNSPELSEILELLIGGYLPTGTPMEVLEAKQKNFGVGALKHVVYPTAKHEWKVSKIIFMHSCADAIPDNLIECIKGVLETVDQVKDNPDIFLLTTKFDLAGDSSIHPIHSSSLKTLKDFEEVENKIADKFNIANRSFRWISITDRVSVDSLYIHNFALKFLKSVLEPAIPVSNNGENFTPAKLLAILISVVVVMLAVWYNLPL